MVAEIYGRFEKYYVFLYYIIQNSIRGLTHFNAGLSCLRV